MNTKEELEQQVRKCFEQKHRLGAVSDDGKLQAIHWDNPSDEELLERIISMVKSRESALLSRVLESLPNKKTDITGYHEDHTPEQLTRITAMNRFYNQAITEVRTKLDQLSKEKMK